MLLFTAYFLGVSVYFACSVSCHVTINHSPVVAFFALRLDFLGIVLLMWTASLPSIYYGFICNPHLQLFHWTLISILAVSCIVATLHPRFGASQFRSYRTALYAGLGLSAAIFVCHDIALHRYDAQERRMALRWMGVMALLNLAGAAAYAVRCPERWFPYRFDFVGASHQIFHFLVVLAGLAHYAELVQALREVRVLGQHCGAVV
jgi:adiponectin receptor